jgi:hypothetical protein
VRRLPLLGGWPTTATRFAQILRSAAAATSATLSCGGRIGNLICAAPQECCSCHACHIWGGAHRQPDVRTLIRKKGCSLAGCTLAGRSRLKRLKTAWALAGQSLAGWSVRLNGLRLAGLWLAWLWLGSGSVLAWLWLG